MRKAKSFGASATSGMMWMSVSVLLSRALLFVMQIVLGFILDARDYGIFAVVSVFHEIVSCDFRNEVLAMLRPAKQVY